jgi:murein DD-endopeptidase MepM/ murein hydrolase activator NlpD
VKLIGELDSVGLSTGYNLHYETYFRDEIINPKILWKLKLIADGQKK